MHAAMQQLFAIKGLLGAGGGEILWWGSSFAASLSAAGASSAASGSTSTLSVSTIGDDYVATVGVAVVSSAGGMIVGPLSGSVDPGSPAGAPIPAPRAPAGSSLAAAPDLSAATSASNYWMRAFWASSLSTSARALAHSCLITPTTIERTAWSSIPETVLEVS
jgi:hypothetical protein